jgi:hypothetical protein
MLGRGLTGAQVCGQLNPGSGAQVSSEEAACRREGHRTPVARAEREASDRTAGEAVGGGSGPAGAAGGRWPEAWGRETQSSTGYRKVGGTPDFLTGEHP